MTCSARTLRTNTTACTLHAHCMHTACTPHAHRMHTACTLHAHCMHTACTGRHLPVLLAPLRSVRCRRARRAHHGRAGPQHRPRHTAQAVHAPHVSSVLRIACAPHHVYMCTAPHVHRMPTALQVRRVGRKYGKSGAQVALKWQVHPLNTVHSPVWHSAWRTVRGTVQCPSAMPQCSAWHSSSFLRFRPPHKPSCHSMHPGCNHTYTGAAADSGHPQGAARRVPKGKP